MLIFKKHSATILLDLIMLDDKSGLASPLFSFVCALVQDEYVAKATALGAGKQANACLIQSSTLSKILIRNSLAAPFAKVASYDAYRARLNCCMKTE